MTTSGCYRIMENARDQDAWDKAASGRHRHDEPEGRCCTYWKRRVSNGCES